MRVDLWQAWNTHHQVIVNDTISMIYIMFFGKPLRITRGFFVFCSFFSVCLKFFWFFLLCRFHRAKQCSWLPESRRHIYSPDKLYFQVRFGVSSPFESDDSSDYSGFFVEIKASGTDDKGFVIGVLIAW